jgi:hypothetical protein
MLQFQKVIRGFAKVKPLKISVTSTDPVLKLKSDTINNEW